MAWQQQQGNYDNYGGYIDPSYGHNAQNQPYPDQYATGPVSKYLKEAVP